MSSRWRSLAIRVVIATLLAWLLVTAPLPPYDPVLTDYLSPYPVYPASYRPGLIEDSTFSTDVNLGFSGGDVAPFIPGSRFRVFDTH